MLTWEIWLELASVCTRMSLLDWSEVVAAPQPLHAEHHIVSARACQASQGFPQHWDILGSGSTHGAASLLGGTTLVRLQPEMGWLKQA